MVDQVAQTQGWLVQPLCRWSILLMLLISPVMRMCSKLLLVHQQANSLCLSNQWSVMWHLTVVWPRFWMETTHISPRLSSLICHMLLRAHKLRLTAFGSA